MDKQLYMTLLYDFYAELLTEKQQQIYEYHHLDDLSLSEVGEQFGITRQAVHDILLRTEKKLLEWEQKLNLIEKYAKKKDLVSRLHEIAHINGDETKEELLQRFGKIRSDLALLEQEL